ELDEKTLQCTRTGQVMLDFENSRSLMDVIREYYVEHKKQPAKTVKELYYSDLYPGINSWAVAEFQGEIPGQDEVQWEARGKSYFEGVAIEKYLLHHSRYLELPLLYIHKSDGVRRPVLLWLGEGGKPGPQDWPALAKYLEGGYDIISVDPRGVGETRMPYKAVSPDDPALAQLDFDHAYVSPLSGVLADYVYNSLLTGRPYFLQMVEDMEIATRFFRAQFNLQSEFVVTGMNEAYTLASAISETLPNIKLLSRPNIHIIKWSDVVNQERELWPIQYLLPGGAYIH
ncbi:MAG TPA: hypothetical protein VFV92_02225, partial [Candidatus Bathyarchaeia archaeon]|nr:hypothetical protein [Candidatus Bathyarchaeia archaeon]